MAHLRKENEMKKLRILIALLFAVLLVVALPVTALAASDSTAASNAINVAKLIAYAEAAAVIIVGFMMSYFRTSSKFRGFVAKLIADAEVKYETVEKAGKAKMAWVVSQLYNYIPAALRPLFSEEQLQDFVQEAFDQISKYATIQLDKAVAALEAKYDSKKKKKAAATTTAETT